jgi:nitrous oxide reductase
MRRVLTNRVASIKPMHCTKIHQLPVEQQLSIHGTRAEQPGIFDTLFKSPDFVEDTDRFAVYIFCLAEKKIPT